MYNFISTFIHLYARFITSAQSLSSPESFDYYAGNLRYLIANKGTNQLLALGTVENLSILVSSIIASHGLKDLDNRLFACTEGNVKVYDVITGTLITTISIEGSFINGISYDGVNNIFVTDFTAKNIYRIDATTYSFNLFVTNTVETPNGILFDDYAYRLLFVPWGSAAKIKAVSLIDSVRSDLITTPFSNIDDLAADGIGSYWVSTWGSNAVYRYNSDFTVITDTISGLSNPADIYYNKYTDTLAIPNSASASTVIFVNYDAPIISGIVDNNNIKIEYTVDYLCILSQSYVFNTTIYSYEGRVITHKKGNSFFINLHTLTPGMYIMNIHDGSQPISYKFIVYN